MKVEQLDTTSHGSVDAARASWTVLSLLDWSARYLKERGYDEARLNVELLLSHVLSLKRIELYLNFDRPLTRDELARFKLFFQRRLRHEPLQYITGEAEFMGLKLFVDRSVLIPRPETELLVEKVLETIRASEQERIEVLDIGTGSGNISIALSHFAPNTHVTAIDVSADALRTAAVNVSRHGLSSVTLKEADIFSDFLPGERFDIIVSNPPYISEMEFQSLEPEIREFEPRVATCDSSDGYRFIRRICEIVDVKLCDGGTLFMEIAYDQSGATRSIVEASGLSDVELFNDYAGIPRVLRATHRRKGN